MRTTTTSTTTTSRAPYTAYMLKTLPEAAIRAAALRGAPGAQAEIAARDAAREAWIRRRQASLTVIRTLVCLDAVAGDSWAIEQCRAATWLLPHGDQIGLTGGTMSVRQIRGTVRRMTDREVAAAARAWLAARTPPSPAPQPSPAPPPAPPKAKPSRLDLGAVYRTRNTPKDLSRVPLHGFISDGAR